MCSPTLRQALAHAGPAAAQRQRQQHDLGRCRRRRSASAPGRRSPSGAGRRPVARVARSGAYGMPAASSLGDSSSMRWCLQDLAQAACSSSGRTATRCAFVASAASSASSGRSMHTAQRQELLVAHRADEQLLVVGEREHVVDAPRRHARGHRRRRLAGHRELLHVLRGKKAAVLEQRALHFLAAAGALALAQRGQHADRAEHAAHDVVDRRAGAQRPPLAGRSCTTGRPSSAPPRRAPAGSRTARAGSPCATRRSGAGTSSTASRSRGPSLVIRPGRKFSSTTSHSPISSSGGRHGLRAS